MHGRLVKTPRWQQAYGKNYEYTHEVPKFTRYRGKRISVTLRAYQ